MPAAAGSAEVVAPVSDTEIDFDEGEAHLRHNDDELRQVLRSVKALVRRRQSQNGLKSLREPVTPGGPSRFDYYQTVLVQSLRNQVPGSIKRIKASKPLSLRTRKIIEALLTLGSMNDAKSA